MTKTLSDQIADIAETAWPLYRESDWVWRDGPVTLARLTAAITDMVTGVADGAGYSTGGLSVYIDDEGNIEVSVEVGLIGHDAVKAWREARTNSREYHASRDDDSQPDGPS